MADLKTGSYIMYVGRKAPKEIFEGLESMVKYRAMVINLKTHKAVRVVEVEVTGPGEVTELAEVYSAPAIT